MSVIYTYYDHHHAKQNYYTKLAMIKKATTYYDADYFMYVSMEYI